MIISNMNGEVKFMNITDHPKLKYVRDYNISGDQGNMQ